MIAVWEVLHNCPRCFWRSSVSQLGAYQQAPAGLNTDREQQSREMYGWSHQRLSHASHVVLCVHITPCMLAE